MSTDKEKAPVCSGSPLNVIIIKLIIPIFWFLLKRCSLKADSSSSGRLRPGRIRSAISSGPEIMRVSKPTSQIIR